MKPEKLSITSEEKRLIFSAIRYYQMFKASYDGKEYQLCQNLLKNLT